MKKFLKIVLWLGLIGLLCGVGVYMYVFHKPHRDLSNEKADFSVTADAFYSEYSADETAGNAKYLDKAIEVSGVIVDRAESEKEISLTLLDAMSGVSCSFDSAYVAENKSKILAFEIGSSVKIKGKCDGIDAIMGIVLTRCVIVEE